MNKATIHQLRCIWALAHKLNYSPEVLRQKISEIYPEIGGHLSSLNTEQAGHIISILKQKLRQAGQPALIKYGRLPRNEPRPFMSPAQTEYALSLAREIIREKIRRGEFTGEDEIKTKEDLERETWRLLHKLAWRIKLNAFDLANTRQAAQIIEALKAMKNRLLHQASSSPLTK